MRLRPGLCADAESFPCMHGRDSDTRHFAVCLQSVCAHNRPNVQQKKRIQSGWATLSHFRVPDFAGLDSSSC